MRPEQHTQLLGAHRIWPASIPFQQDHPTTTFQVKGAMANEMKDVKTLFVELPVQSVPRCSRQNVQLHRIPNAEGPPASVSVLSLSSTARGLNSSGWAATASTRMGGLTRKGRMDSLCLLDVAQDRVEGRVAETREAVSLKSILRGSPRALGVSTCKTEPEGPFLHRSPCGAARTLKDPVDETDWKSETPIWRGRSRACLIFRSRQTLSAQAPLAVPPESRKE